MTSPIARADRELLAAPPDLTLSRYTHKIRQLRTEHRTRLDLMDLYERLYHKRHWEEAPQDEIDWEVVFPVHTLTVNTAHAIATGMPPTIRAYPNNPESQADQKRADDIERWHAAVDRENTLERETDQWELAQFNQVQFGVGVMRELYNIPADWVSGAAEQDDLDQYPVVQHAIDPRQVYWEWGDPPRGRFRMIFYEFELTVRDIESLYGIRCEQRINDRGELLEWDQEHTRTVIDCWEWVGREIVHCIYMEGHTGYATGPDSSDDDEPSAYTCAAQWIKNPTPMPEYYVLPYHCFPFYETSSRDPEAWGVSILFLLTDVVHYLEILASRKMRQIEMFSDPIILAARRPDMNGGGSGEGPIPIENRPGVVIDLVAGDEVKYLQWSGSGPDEERLWQKISDLIHEVGFPQTLLAQGSTDATGFRTALDRETGLLRIAKSLQHYQDTRARVYSARAYALSKLLPDTRIRARGLTQAEGKYTVSLTGKRLGQYRDIAVEVKPRFPGDLQRDIQVATAAMAAHIWDMEEAREYIPPPSGRSKQALADGAKQDMLRYHPAVVDAEAQIIAQEIMKDYQGDQPQPDPSAPGQPGSPGPTPGMPGMPGTGGTPGQPAGANPMSGQSAGIDNRLRQSRGTSLPPGTVTPTSLPARIGSPMPFGGP